MTIKRKLANHQLNILQIEIQLFQKYTERRNERKTTEIGSILNQGKRVYWEKFNKDAFVFGGPSVGDICGKETLFRPQNSFWQTEIII